MMTTIDLVIENEALLNVIERKVRAIFREHHFSEARVSYGMRRQIQNAGWSISRGVNAVGVKFEAPGVPSTTAERNDALIAYRDALHGSGDVSQLDIIITSERIYVTGPVTKDELTDESLRLLYEYRKRETGMLATEIEHVLTSYLHLPPEVEAQVKATVETLRQTADRIGGLRG